MAASCLISARDLLVAHGVRPTRQRRVLASLLFADARRHTDAQTFHAEAEQSGNQMSVATVYNAL